MKKKKGNKFSVIHLIEKFILERLNLFREISSANINGKTMQILSTHKEQQKETTR